MFRKFSILFSLSIFIFITACNSTSENKKEQTNRPDKFTIAFGSCNKQFVEEQFWDEILAQNPDLWIWGGDNIYADTDDMELMKEKYDLQKNRPDYQNFISKVAVIGTWDDHDYGINDGGKFFKKKDESKALMLDFLDVDQTHEVWNRAGVYQSYTYGEENKAIKILLLDTRYFRDTIIKSSTEPRYYLPNEEGDILGEEQWAWLEKELTNSSASYHIVLSSIQFLSEEHRFEKWANFPRAQQRFYKLLEQTKPKNLLIISGDRHISEVSKKNIKELPYPLYDVTSSGMTHTWRGSGPDEPNAYREGPLIKSLSYGLLHVNIEQELIDIALKGYSDSTFYTHSIHFK